MSSMRLNQHNNTSRLFSTADTFGEIQIVAGSDRLVVDVQARNYDTAGHLHRDHALADLSLAAAARLRDLLSEAIEHCHSVTLDRRQTALWSNSASTARVSRRSV
jgi:hypothetical protein